MRVWMGNELHVAQHSAEVVRHSRLPFAPEYEQGHFGDFRERMKEVIGANTTPIELGWLGSESENFFRVGHAR